MVQVFLALFVVAVSLLLLSVRLLCGKKNFVHTHIDGNRALNAKGIHCAKDQDKKGALGRGFKIEEHSKADTENK